MSAAYVLIVVLIAGLVVWAAETFRPSPWRHMSEPFAMRALRLLLQAIAILVAVVVAAMWLLGLAQVAGPS